MSDEQLLGVLVLFRHGDRLQFYQDPTTYGASETAITPLGSQQEFQLGQLLRSLYFNASSASCIHDISTGLFNDSQVSILADAGDEGGVIYDSAVAFTQGLWPATTTYNISLANGSSIVGPLGGYQYVPINTVQLDNDISLQGWVHCAPFSSATKAFYNSPAFLQKQNETAAFLNQLLPYLDGRPVTLQNMWNVYDYMNVQFIHDANFAKTLPPTFLEQARDLANWHEYNTFTSPQLSGIGNIAGRAVLPAVINSLTRISNASDPIKFACEAISYKPFLSLFNMTNAAQAHPELASIVNYAAALALEVRQPSSGGSPVLRLNFKNGSDSNFQTYTFLNGSGDVPLSEFVNYLSPVTVNTTSDWCRVCQNTQNRGCDEIASAASQGHAQALAKQPVSPIGAGFLGAGLALAAAVTLLAAFYFLGFMRIGRNKPAIRDSNSEKAFG